MYDFSFYETGCLTIVQPEHAEADDVLPAFCPDATWMGASLVCETRYAPELAAALCREGYVVMLPNGRVVSAGDLAA